jgi:hypothetical protein
MFDNTYHQDIHRLMKNSPTSYVLHTPPDITLKKCQHQSLWPWDRAGKHTAMIKSTKREASNDNNPASTVIYRGETGHDRLNVSQISFEKDRTYG